MKRIIPILLLTLIFHSVLQAEKVAQWSTYEICLEGIRSYNDPLYDVTMGAVFTSPTGKTYKTEGFWDGGNCWRIRFMPNEKGQWSYLTYCSDMENQYLDRQQGEFRCVRNDSKEAIYRRGRITIEPNATHFSYADGTPLFYLAGTAWNGSLRSTKEEWQYYLQHRKDQGFNAIQLVTTQWRGLPAEVMKPAAFEGTEHIKVNPTFFAQLDEKIAAVNRHGMTASAVMLWACCGNESPGLGLPTKSAIKLARYIKARYDAYHVIWFLGGDGEYTGSVEDKWKQIGRETFNTSNDHQGLVTIHTGGRKWYGNDYDSEPWLDFVSYQTGHINDEPNIRWKMEGPVAENWDKLTPRPLLDTEPTYGRIGDGNDSAVRNSALWSLFSSRVAGIGYGHYATWPWLYKGEKSYGHKMKAPSADDWQDGTDSNSSQQIAMLKELFAQFRWWRLEPAHALILNRYESASVLNWPMALADSHSKLKLFFLPTPQTIHIDNTDGVRYRKARWYNPATSEYTKANIIYHKQTIEATSQGKEEAVLILE